MVTEHTIWVALRDWDIGQDVQVEGVRQSGEIELFARYRADVMTEAYGGVVSPNTGHAFIGWAVRLDGVSWQITEAEELPRYGRRRFMKIRGARST